MSVDRILDGKMVSTTQELRESAKKKQMFALATELDILHREGALCDVFVTVDDKRFGAHKVGYIHRAGE